MPCDTALPSTFPRNIGGLTITSVCIEAMPAACSALAPNGGCPTPAVAGIALVCLGIHQQFTAPGYPWMNGRIERLFLKGWHRRHVACETPKASTNASA